MIWLMVSVVGAVLMVMASFLEMGRLGRVGLVFAIAGLVGGIGSAADAQGRNCADRDAIAARLADRYGESRKAFGLTQRGTMIEVFASDETGTWTILTVTGEKIACMVAAGTDFQATKEPLKKGDDL